MPESAHSEQCGYRTALVRMHLSTVLFGLSAIFGKLIMISASALVCGRGFFAVAALSFVFLARKKSPLGGMSPAKTLSMLISGLLLTAHFVTFFQAIKLGGVAVATLGFACFPAFVSVFEAIGFHERLSKREVFLLGFVTIGLALLPTEYTVAARATQGLLWGVLSGAVYAVLGVVNRKNAGRVEGYQASWWQNGIIALCLVPFTWGELLQASFQDWFWMGCLGIFCSALAYTLFVNSLKVIRARVAAIIISMEPLYAIALNTVIFHEAVPGKVLVGGAIIILAVLLYPKR